MGYFDKLKKMVGGKKKEGDRKPNMDESDNPNASEAATSFAKMISGGKKKDEEKAKKKY